MKVTHPTDTQEKALQVNLDDRRYGSFAEIGAGQEVVRWFFRVGGAAGTVAKSICAYDMKVSDTIYGDCKRYVSRERLQAMLDIEQELNHKNLKDMRGDDTAFFAFADTVSARNYHGTNECHGWMGIKFQAHPRDDESQIIIHVRMWDNDAKAQQEALGIVGTNLVYGACFLYHEPEALLRSLLDGLSTNRIEIDMIEFSGIAFRNVDNRVMTLYLVELGLTDAAMFSANGEVLQPSSVLRKKPVLIERGRFRPITNVNVDMLECALNQFEDEDDINAGETITVMEMNMTTLRADGKLDLKDFISRVEVLATTGHTVMISDFTMFYQLAQYISRYTNRRIGIAMGVPTLFERFTQDNYANLQGGMLEGFGRLLKNDIKMYIYPTINPDGSKTTLESVEIEGAHKHLFEYLVEDGRILAIEGYREEVLGIFSQNIHDKIHSGDDSWEESVPGPVAKAIKEKGLFGYKA